MRSKFVLREARLAMRAEREAGSSCWGCGVSCKGEEVSSRGFPSARNSIPLLLETRKITTAKIEGQSVRQASLAQPLHQDVEMLGSAKLGEALEIGYS
jgi:hypothetical protein